MPKKKNIVFIWTDQQRADTLFGQWSEKLKTPNLDAFAKEAAVFTRGYCASPVCTPSRGTVLTGLYPHSHTLIGNGGPLPLDKPTIAEMLKPEGYVTGYMGKWHLGNEIVKQRGFDVWKVTENYYKGVTDPEYLKIPSAYDVWLREEKGFTDGASNGVITYCNRTRSAKLPEDMSKPEFLSMNAIEFIKENKDKPFLLHVNFLEPHPPYFSSYDNYYKPEEVELPPAFMHKLDDRKPLKFFLGAEGAKRVGRHNPLDTEQLWRELIAHYWGMVTHVDVHAGKIIDAIKAEGLWDDTIVVYTSDHGDMMGDYGMLAKGMMHDSCSKVPYVIRIPGLTDKGVKIDAAVDNADLVPTVLDAAGIKVPSHIEGKSLVRTIKGTEDTSDFVAVSEYRTGKYGKGKEFLKVCGGELGDEPQYEKWQTAVPARYPKDCLDRQMVTSDGWKLVLTEFGENIMFDLNADPLEAKNLYGLDTYSEKQAELWKRFRQWQQKTNDTAVFPEKAVW